jgi:hypothetical protein
MEVITASNYNASFTPGTDSCLPNGGTGFAVSDMSDASKSIVRASALTTQVATLLTSKSATAPATLDPNNMDPASVFKTKTAIVRSNMEKEYCFYYKRYLWVLNEVLTKAASTTALTGTAAADYTLQRAAAGTLNSKLNQILQVMQELINSRSASLNGYYSSSAGGVNQLNTELDTMRETLKGHSTQLQSKSLETDVQSAMIDYTLEKNSSSRNLLAVYWFINIVAIGMLFYLYRTAKA